MFHNFCHKITLFVFTKKSVSFLFKKRLLIIFVLSQIMLVNCSTANANDATLSYESSNYQSLSDEVEFVEFEKSFQKPKINDPYESFNRKVYKFNDVVDRYFLEPIAKTYRYSIPKIFRKSISNFTNNVSLPISAVNSFAQGKIDNGLATFSNFLINSTIGVFGIFDIAGEKGIKYKKEDFGQTLAYHNLPSGSYLMLPFLGPSTTRDASGMIFDKSIDIFGFNALQIGGSSDLIDSEYRIINSSLSIVNAREGLIEIIDGVRRDSFDAYSTIRSAYIQKRQSQISN